MDAMNSLLKRYGGRLAGLLGAGLLFLLATFYTGQQLVSARAQWLSQLNAPARSGATWLTLDSGLFQQRGELHLVLLDGSALPALLGLSAAPELSEQLAALGPLDLYVTIDSQVLPGRVRHQARLQVTRGTLGALRDQGLLQIQEPQLQWGQGWGQDGQLTLAWPGGRWQLADGALVLDGLQLAWRPDGKDGRQLDWQLAELTLDQGDDRLLLSQWQGQLGLSRQAAQWRLTECTSQLAQLLRIGGAERLELAGAEFAFGLTANKHGLQSVVDLHGRGRLSAGQWQQAQRRYTLEQLELGLSLGGIDVEGYQALLQSALTRFDRRAVWLAALNRVTRSGFQLHLEPFRLQLDTGRLQASGEVTSRPFDMASLTDIASFRSLLQGVLELEADASLAPMVTDSGTLLAMQDAGYVTDQAGVLNSRLRVVNGKLSANGNAIQW